MFHFLKIACLATFLPSEGQERKKCKEVVQSRDVTLRERENPRRRKEKKNQKLRYLNPEREGHLQTIKQLSEN